MGYARVSTSKQDLDRQVDALQAVGIDPTRIYLDKKSGSTVDRPGLRAVTGYARTGDVIVVHTLDRLGRTVRDTLNLIHELAERGVGVRNLADPIKVDSANPSDPMAQLAVVLLLYLLKWSGPTRWNGRRTPEPWPLPRAGASAALPWSTRTSSTTPAGYGRKGRPSRRS